MIRLICAGACSWGLSTSALAQKDVLTDPPGASKSGLGTVLRSKADRPPFEVAPVNRSTRRAVKEAAALIDDMLAADRKAKGIGPGKAVDDFTFVRRVYLDLGGRIPTCDEVLRFMASKGSERRADLIDEVLESPDYVSRFYCAWADTLRLGEIRKTNWFEPYLDWVKTSIASNRPYDEWVREMLTADGKMWENPAVGYQLRDTGMQLPYVDNTVRVFLGTQIGCAQCHDHPTADWKQEQFYELAALTYGDPSGVNPLRDAKGKLATQMSQDWSGARRLLDALSAAKRQGTGEDAKFDPSYLLRNNATVVGYRPAPLELRSRRGDGETVAVKPRLLWQLDDDLPETADGRVVFAAWITSRANRQFSRTIANRLWKLLFGVGIVEPIDDFSDSNPPSHPELLEHLADEILRLDFDLREFVRIIVSTQAWQQAAVPHDPLSGEIFAFNGPALRRMSAEQLWDSVLTLAAHDIWSYQRPTADEVAATVNVDLANDNVGLDEIWRVQGVMLRSPAVWFQGALNKRLNAYNYILGTESYVRASELPTPVPLGHPLRLFGQSDRETIDGGRTDATITQVLCLLNSHFSRIAIEPKSYLSEAISKRPPEEWADVIFVSILARRPDSEERKIAGEAIASARTAREGVDNVVHALLNTREFLFIQ
jgi:hypothetical protein